MYSVFWDVIWEGWVGKGNTTCCTKHVLSVTKTSSDRRHECIPSIVSVCKEIHCCLAIPRGAQQWPCSVACSCQRLGAWQGSCVHTTKQVLVPDYSVSLKTCYGVRTLDLIHLNHALNPFPVWSLLAPWEFVVLRRMLHFAVCVHMCMWYRHRIVVLKFLHETSQTWQIWMIKIQCTESQGKLSGSV